MGLCTSYGVGGYAANETHLHMYDRLARHDGSKMGVIFCHGYGGTSLQAVEENPRRILGALTKAGFPVLSIDAGGPETFGNDLSIQRVGEAVDYLQGVLGAKSGKVVLIGASMGGLVACNWTRQNLLDVAGVVGLTPALDLLDIEAQAEYTADLYAAYGGQSAFSAGLATHNPAQFADELTSIPFQLWYSDNDTETPASMIQGFAAAVGGWAISSGAQGHSFAGIEEETVVDFVANLAD